ncbi:armadillo-type protein [Schizophyllum amplum]|uniref:Armadillo-type protein n=1 Tax=Schizophyllum amplum TaxID=97359 RepID=A0A550CWB3_9AGAR|nr:armadillo-type protein [Auriculariopsis ampla]
MEVCKEKPDRLPPLDAIGLEPVGPADFAMSRGGSHRKPSNAQAPSRPASGLGGPGGAFGGKPGGGSAFGGMGNFQTPGSKLTSQERFERANSITSSPTMGFARPSAITRSASQGGPGAADNKRTRSQRGNKRGDRQDGGGGGGGGKFNGPPPGHSAFGHNANNLMNLEPVAPLQKSENRWDPRTRPPTNEPDSPEVVDRKVKGLLNKLTMEKFDSLSDQIIAWANKSEKEKDGRTLIQVIRLVFEKATDEAAWSEMYARLCRKMMEQISPKVQDDGIKNAEGKPITGGQLFRKYLLNRCQEDFERGWVNKEATAAAAATKAVEDKAVQAANANKEGGDNAQEPDLYSEEYYAAQKAKRQGLGLIRFIGELFKLQMLTERIMHQCVQKLLGNVENPEEEEIESLAKLLTTVGELLDTPRAHAHMDVYFARMKELTKKPSVNSRMQFMLQDLVELRERGWRGRTASAGPATIAQIHELAAKEKAAQEKETMHRQSTMSRGGSRRGGERRDSEHVGPDGWTVAGSAPRPPAKAGDLSKFGSISKPTQMTFGPSSVFAGKKDKRESLSRAASTSNMFHALQSEGAEPVTAPKSSRPPSRKPSVDLTAAGAEGLPQRRKLVLQPRTKPLEENKPDGSDSEEEEEGSTAAAPAAEMTDEAAKKKVGEDIKEFFAIRNMEEAENYFTTLPAPHHHLLVDKLVGQALESKEADVKLVADLFAHALSKDLVSHDALEEGMAPTMEFLEDIAIDVPKAWDFMALLVKAASFDEERRTRLVEKSSGADKLLALLS